MSFQAMSCAIKAKMPATEKLVFLLMANYADDKNECWPSYTTLADEAGVSERTIARVVDRLAEFGWLEVLRQGNARTSSKYQLNFDGTEIPKNTKKKPSKEGRQDDKVDNMSTLPTSTPCPPRVDNMSVLGRQDVHRSYQEPITEPITKDLLSGDSRTDDIKQVIDHLNSVTGSKFKPSAKASTKNISGRLSDGASVQDLKLVIDYKASEWLNDSKMCQFLRPSTLFGPEKFNGYLIAAKNAMKGTSNGTTSTNYQPSWQDSHATLQQVRAETNRRIQELGADCE